MSEKKVCPDCGEAADVVKLYRNAEDGGIWRTYADLTCGHKVIVAPHGK